MNKTVIRKTGVPEHSILKDEEASFGYIDSFQSSFSGKEKGNDIIPIAELFSSSGPEWANSLLRIRDKIVKPFGLKTADQITDFSEQPDDTRYELGSQHGIFKLFYKRENEVVLGQDDTHLNVRVSLLLESSGNEVNKILSITTAVKFNNLFGKLYFLPVKPIHQLIVRKSLENIVLQIENNGNEG